jgi:hypothetical protein
MSKDTMIQNWLWEKEWDELKEETIGPDWNKL